MIGCKNAKMFGSLVVIYEIWDGNKKAITSNQCKNIRARNKTNFPAQIRADTPVPSPSPDGSLCSIALPPNHLTYGTPLRRIVRFKTQNAKIFGSLAPLARNHL